MQSEPSDSSGAPIGAPLVRNRLLRALPASERAALLDRVEHVRLARGRALCEVGRPIEHLYFLESGVASVLCTMADGGSVEIATVGDDGVVGLPLFHGVERAPEQAFMQIEGSAYRVSATELDALLADAPTLAALLHRSSVAMFSVAAQNSACNRKHSVAQRCARWLLMVHDRTRQDDLGLTHAFLARMLGVRRASVTEALGGLQRAGALGINRGQLHVRSAATLAAASCECYLVIRRALDRVTGEGLEAIPSEVAHSGEDGGGSPVAGTRMLTGAALD